MSLSAFAAPGQFWRGNIHTHSTRSDGVRAPGEVARAYRDAGYDFLCLSDHFTERFGWPIVDLTSSPVDGLTTIPGAEIHAPMNSHGEIWHVLACGLPLDFPQLGEGEDMVALAARAKAAGAYVGIAHPQWSQLTIADGRQLAASAHAVEIYNTGCDIECARPDGFYLLDELLNEGHRHLTAYAADDAHFRIPDAFGGWVMAKAEANAPDRLVEALKRGDFYSSQGPSIDALARDGDALVVACSPARNIALVGRGSRAVNSFGDGLVTARLGVERFAGEWCRLIVTDEKGRNAWSNPIWID